MQWLVSNITPAELEGLTNVRPDILRNWRQKGFLYMADIGQEQDNGRWLYSVRDAAVIAAMEVMRLSGEGMRRAVHICAMVDVDICSSAVAKRNGLRTTYLALWVPSHEGVKNITPWLDGAVQKELVLDLSALEKINSPIAALLNLHAMVDTFPKALVDRIVETRGKATG